MTDAGRIQAERLLEQFKRLHQAVVAFVAACSDTEWQRLSVREGWSCAVIAHHIGTAHYAAVVWVQMIAYGQPTKLTIAEVLAMNAGPAGHRVAYSQTETLTFLQSEADKVVDIMMSLNDPQLSRQAYLQVAGGKLSAAQLFRALVIDAARTHLESMKSATSLPAD